MPLVLLNLGEDESFSLFDNQENKVFDFFWRVFFTGRSISPLLLYLEKKKCPHLPSLNNQKMFERPSFHLSLRGASLIAVICWKLVIFTL